MWACPFFLSEPVLGSLHRNKKGAARMAKDTTSPLLIKRYASRRLYNTETSDYVTLDVIAGFIRDGRDVKIVDLKTGDDLTRQYLLQIIAEHESRGENVLPIAVLTDLVRSYSTQAQSVVPQFLAQSFEALRDSQAKMVENMTSMTNPLSSMPGFDAMQKQQAAFLKSMMSGWPGGTEPMAEAPEVKPAPEAAPDTASELDEIKRQLAALQAQLAGKG